MPRRMRTRKAIARSLLADLRQASEQGDVTVEPASSTTDDQPELTDADVAPEASPAATKKTAAKSKSKAKS